MMPSIEHHNLRHLYTRCEEDRLSQLYDDANVYKSFLAAIHCLNHDFVVFGATEPLYSCSTKEKNRCQISSSNM